MNWREAFYTDAKPYAAYRQHKIESGLVYQDFVADVCLEVLGLPIVQYTSQLYQQTKGESRTGVEIKHDEKFASTGNLYIEIGEKAEPRPGPYAPAGIYRSDNTWLYLIGNYDTIFVFAKLHLRGLHQSDRYHVIENGMRTSLGFLVPEADARHLAVCILTPHAARKVSKAIHDLGIIGRELQRIACGEIPSPKLF